MRAMRGDSITRTRVGAGRGTGVVSERVSDACCMRGPYMLMRATHCIAACALSLHNDIGTRWYARGMLAACRVACSLACWCMQLHIRMLMARSCIPTLPTGALEVCAGCDHVGDLAYGGGQEIHAAPRGSPSSGCGVDFLTIPPQQ